MTKLKSLEKYEVRDHRYTGEVRFVAEISVTPDMGPRTKLGLAVRWGLKNHADLSRADLSGANLSGADLSRADLSRACLCGAILSWANLSRADLSGADLSGADLYGANLSRADLSGANLSGADLSRADLSGADLYGANLKGAKNLKLPHFQIPQEGELIVWKALGKEVLCKLRIPPEARRTASVVGRKCRAEFAEVIEGEGVGKHDGKTRYTPGQIVYPDSYDDDPLVECTHGIHFFLTKEEAREWL